MPFLLPLLLLGAIALAFARSSSGGGSAPSPSPSPTPRPSGGGGGGGGTPGPSPSPPPSPSPSPSPSPGGGGQSWETDFDRSLVPGALYRIGILAAPQYSDADIIAIMSSEPPDIDGHFIPSGIEQTTPGNVGIGIGWSFTGVFVGQRATTLPAPKYGSFVYGTIERKAS